MATASLPNSGGRGGGPGETGFGGYTWHYIDKPTIAAVEGYAVGGGLEMCLASDLVVASADATFALPEVKRGFFAGADGVQRLARQMPAKVALDYLLTGRPFSAEVAHQWGLVSRLVPAGTALGSALALAEEIAANAPLAVAATKRVAHAAFDQVWSEEIARHQFSNAQRIEIRGTADFREGVAAFLEKRTPNWTGT